MSRRRPHPRYSRGRKCRIPPSSSSPSTAPMPKGSPGCFASLGFVLAGRHRSKAVERWSQGDINLLINIFRRQLCTVALHDPRFGRVRDRAASRRRRWPHEPGRRAACDHLPAAGRAGRDDDPRDPRRRRQSAVLSRAGLAQLGCRLRCGRRTGARLAPPRRSHLAIDAIRGDAVVGAVLYRAVRPAPRAAARDRRSAGTGEEPGPAKQGGLAAARAQRLDGDANHVVALPLGVLRRRRSAHCVCLRRHLQGRDRHARGRRDVPDHPRQLLRRYRQPLRNSIPRCFDP